MDIKSRKFNAVLFVICVAMFTTCMVTGLVMATGINAGQGSDWDYEDALRGKKYENSNALQSRFVDKYELISDLLKDTKKVAGTGNEYNEDVSDAMRQLFYDGEYMTEDGDIYRANYPVGIDGSQDYGYPEIRAAFIAANQEAQAAILTSLRNLDAEEIKYGKKQLDSEKGFRYYAKSGNTVITNMPDEAAVISADYFTAQQAYLVYENGQMKKQPASAKSVSLKNLDTRIESFLDELRTEESDGNLQMYFAFDADNMAAAEKQYNNANTGVVNLWPLLLASALLTLISFVWLAIITGRKDAEGNRNLYAIDKIWTELQLIAVACAGCAGYVFMAEMMWHFNRSYGFGYDYTALYSARETLSTAEITISGVVIAALATVGLWFVLSLIRLIKDGQFFKNAVLYKLGSRLADLVAEVINGKGMLRKALVISIAACLLSATVFMAPVVLIAILVFVPEWARRFDELKQGVDEVRSGNLTYKIPVREDKKAAELSRLAKGINEISEASNIAVQNELKNQRMKTELISNVSHDLKTPLTSMVSYVDLLKKEGPDSENAPQYLDILEQKTERLSKLTEDLFEAAKASSGAIPVNLEKVDLLALVNQSLGEMSKSIDESGLEFIINAPEERCFVTADGRLLWRVVENLLGNVIKYAQAQSRVYIDIKEMSKGKGANGLQNGHSMILLEVKNISKQALNIDPDELMERFKRGDESRTTEGSGLGLAIAKDLVRLMDGWFEIAIDGDLFKAKVMLNKAE